MIKCCIPKNQELLAWALALLLHFQRSRPRSRSSSRARRSWNFNHDCFFRLFGLGSNIIPISVRRGRNEIIPIYVHDAQGTVTLPTWAHPKWMVRNVIWSVSDFPWTFVQDNICERLVCGVWATVQSACANFHALQLGTCWKRNMLMST